MITKETKIEDCDLSIRIKRLFKNAKIETIKQLLENNLSSLMKFRGLGRASILEIVNYLNTNGFYFKD